MRIAGLLLPLLLLPLAPAQAQEIEPPDGVRIASVQLSGLDLTRLSAPLQDDINALAGTPLSRQRLRELAARIETEQPRYIVGVRATQDPDGGARVFFVVGRMRDQGREPNINSRYVVESVEIRGVPNRDLDPMLRTDLYALAGRPLDSDEADRLETRMRDALHGYDVQRRTTRGSVPGTIRVIFTAARAEWAQWLRFEPIEANALFHSDQGWGANFPISMGGRDFHVTPVFAVDIGDELIEEYSGFALRFESLKLGTERLGLFFEWSNFDSSWRTPTFAALTFDPRIPPPYRNRMNVTPVLKFAITPQLTLGGGVSITELDPLLELPEGLLGAPDGQMANAAVGSLSFARRSPPGSRPRHDVEAAIAVHAGMSELESDLVYERYLGHAGYSTRFANHRLRVSGMAGRIDGSAPLFERFSLGDSRTLRGWNKYDIAPAGGDRMYHTSLEYEFYGMGWFLDTGAVWNAGREHRLRVSTGLNFTPGPVFFTLGFPLNTDEFRAVFTMGYRFTRPLAGIKKY